MPSVDPSHYQHPLDMQTLQALQSVPVFPAFMKAFMRFFNEPLFFNENISSHIEVTQDHFGEVYRLLPPVCQRIGIPIPHLYICNDGSINAYTSNESDPFIVLNSGVLDYCTERQIQTILAHECGHIACHHVLYHTVGDMVLSGVLAIVPGLGGLMSVALQGAFMSWMRASELSADRAAALAMGDPMDVVDMCAVLAGAYGERASKVDHNRLIQQGLAYEQNLQGSTKDKILELISFSLNGSHPRTAVRALEAVRFGSSPEYSGMLNFINQPSSN